MFHKSNILLPTDFSPYAQHSMKYALGMAKKYDGMVHFLHVIDEAILPGGVRAENAEGDSLFASMKDHAESRLLHLSQLAEDEGVKAVSHTVTGRPDAEILNYLESHGCTMIVLATHGRAGFDHIVFGSVAERVVRQSPVPVLSVKHPEHDFVKETDLSLSIERILFPTDFSAFSEKALPFAVSLCKEFGAKLTLLHASEVSVALPEFMPDAALTVGADMEASAREALDHLCAQLQGIIDVEPVSVTGMPHREICRIVEATSVDLVVMPTHGRSGLSHILFGSVAEKVVRLAHCPVLTIRPDWPGPAAQ